MNINLELYKIFYTVAKYKSFSEASKKLYISQPAITQRINNLEKQLNCKLFYRMANGIKLTEYGEKLFDYIKSSMEIMSNVENKFNEYVDNKNEKQILKIQTASAIDNIYIYNTMLKTLIHNSSLSISVIENSNIKNGLDALSNKEIDLLMFDFPYNIRKRDIEVIVQDELEQILYTSKEYYEKNKTINIYKENKYNFILPNKESLEREKIDKYFIKNNIYINSSYEINDLNIREFLVDNNLGIGLGIKEKIKKGLNNGKFIEIPLKTKLPTYNIYIAKLRNNKSIEELITKKEGNSLSQSGG